MIDFEPLESGALRIAGGGDPYTYHFIQVGAAVDGLLTDPFLQLAVSGPEFDLVVPRHPRLSVNIVMSGSGSSLDAPRVEAAVSGLTTQEDVAVALPSPVNLKSPSDNDLVSLSQGTISWDARPSAIYEVTLVSTSSDSKSLCFYVAEDHVKLSRLVEAGFVPVAGVKYTLRVEEYGPFGGLTDALSASGLPRYYRMGRTGYSASSEARSVYFK